MVGNKRDLAEELGYMVENSLLPYPTMYIGASPETLVRVEDGYAARAS